MNAAFNKRVVIIIRCFLLFQAIFGFSDLLKLLNMLNTVLEMMAFQGMVGIKGDDVWIFMRLTIKLHQNAVMVCTYTCEYGYG